MKIIITIQILLIASINAFGQLDTLVDDRDNKVYRVMNFNGKDWMIDNLDFESEHAMKFHAEEQMELDLVGRYYPYFELDSLCPTGWRLPNYDDWSGYFQYAYDALNIESGKEENKERYPSVIYMYCKSEAFNLFYDQNPIALQPNFMIEGGKLLNQSQAANYWTKNDNAEYKNRTHVHITSNTLTVHSHKGKLEKKKPKKMRMFMIRCVAEKDKD